MVSPRAHLESSRRRRTAIAVASQTGERGTTFERAADAPRAVTTRAWLIDMDGVLVREERPIRGAERFLARLAELGHAFLILTNNSIYTPRDLAARLRGGGLDVPEPAIWTSALATASFLDHQCSGGSAFVIGEAGLTTALHQAGYTLTDRDPDYVVLGETRIYSFQRITRAIRLVNDGARFIATNPDPTGPSPDGPMPATGAVAALISRATGVDPYFVGKPNPLMIRSALNALDVHSGDTAIVGDRMDTDVISGIEAGLETVLVLSGVTTRAQAERSPFRPGRIVESVTELLDDLA
jgi:NagD protein